MGSIIQLLIMVVLLLLACFFSAAQAGPDEQVHVSGSTGPTVVGSGHTPVYAPHYYGYGHAPVYASHYYPHYPRQPYVSEASTHGYGNVEHAYGTPYMYTRQHPDPHYGEQTRQGYSSYAPLPSYVSPYYRHPYSYVAATHGYGNVEHAYGTPYMYSRQQPDPHYGEQDRQGYSSYAPLPSYVSP